MQNKCFFCSQLGHYARECPLKHPNHKKTPPCHRCGRHSHTVTKCRAQIHLNGDTLGESLAVS